MSLDHGASNPYIPPMRIFIMTLAFLSMHSTLLWAEPSVEFVVASTSVPEDVGNTEVIVWLSELEPDNDVVVDVLAVGSATAEGVDHDFTRTSVTIPAGEIANTASFSITDDDDVEGDESIIFVLANPMSATLGTNVSQTVTILDDDLVSSSASETATAGAAATTSLAPSVATGSFSMGGYGCSLRITR